MTDVKMSPINMIKYIKRNVDYLSINERQDILQMIINALPDDSKIQTKGDGTQIKFKDIPSPTIASIYT